MSSKTIAFLGASCGVGLSALKCSLDAGHQCIALCRVPSKLTSISLVGSHPNLKVVLGNAHDVSAVSKCLVDDKGNLVDEVIFTIGGKFIFYRLTLDDPEVCRKGIKTLLSALNQLRTEGLTGKPHIIVCSTTGLSKFGRDIPILMVPLYYLLIRVPHEDKEVMEYLLVESGERFTIVRASLLSDGETDTKIRVGIEDPRKGVESREIGYFISREDAGKWIAGNMNNEKYFDKVASITY